MDTLWRAVQGLQSNLSDYRRERSCVVACKEPKVGRTLEHIGSFEFILEDK